MALETLSAVCKIAGDMKKAALELHEEFSKEERKVEETLENTQRARSAKALDIEQQRKERKEMETNKQMARAADERAPQS